MRGETWRGGRRKKKGGRRDGREANGAGRGTRTSIHWHDAGRGINDPFLHRYFRCLLRIIALRRQIYRCFLFLSRDRGEIVGRRAPPSRVKWRGEILKEVKSRWIFVYFSKCNFVKLWKFSHGIERLVVLRCDPSRACQLSWLKSELGEFSPFEITFEYFHTVSHNYIRRVMYSVAKTKKRLPSTRRELMRVSRI